jgi:hypothetical protein
MPNIAIKSSMCCHSPSKHACIFSWSVPIVVSWMLAADPITQKGIVLVASESTRSIEKTTDCVKAVLNLTRDPATYFKYRIVQCQLIVAMSVGELSDWMQASKQEEAVGNSYHIDFGVCPWIISIEPGQSRFLDANRLSSFSWTFILLRCESVGLS